MKLRSSASTDTNDNRVREHRHVFPLPNNKLSYRRHSLTNRATQLCECNGVADLKTTPSPSVTTPNFVVLDLNMYARVERNPQNCGPLRPPKNKPLFICVTMPNSVSFFKECIVTEENLKYRGAQPLWDRVVADP